MLPIRKIVLYKHGVGYFERQGKVSGDATVDLHFKASEMNDVLKSLTVLDLGGGIVASISYESTKPVEKQLEDIAIRLPEKNALTGLLSQIRGAQVQVEVGSQTVEGTITGIETVTRKAGEEMVWSQYLSLLTDGTTLKSFDLLEIKQISFLDVSLQKDLQHLLEILIAAKKKDLKRLTIFARGRGDDERPLVASYIVETPVWKTSYRVLLKNESEQGKEETLIQGWALVDNTQDEDWEDVQLTLVAGLPISFVHDLYSPRYKRRPVVQVQEEEAYAPPVLEEAVDELMADFEMPGDTPVGGVNEYAAAPRRALARRPAMAAPAPAAPPVPQAMAKAEALRRSVDVQTRTVEVGDLFQYAIQNAVTVKRNQSALVPILQKPFEGTRVAVYNPTVREKNPMSAVLFKNTTGMTLEGGPLTVLEGETYVGEAMLETMKPDEERLVPFSVELGCTVTVDSESELQTVHMARITHGTLYLHRFRVEKTVYLVRNKLERELDLYIEHRFKEGWKLVEPESAAEKTESFYRFRLSAPPRKTTRFVVAEKGDMVESWQIQTVDRKQIGVWLEKRYIGSDTQQALERLVELGDKAATLDHWIQQRQNEIEEIYSNQERLRENLQALGSSRDEQGLRERYIEALSVEEDRLTDLRQQLQQWREEKGAIEEEMGSMVRNLELEVQL
jgi:hypothetical protein